MLVRIKILFLILFVFQAIYLSDELIASAVYGSSMVDDSTFIGQVEVKRWQDDKASAFSFSFDDGLMSQFTFAFPILNQYEINGTFYLLPPYITEELPGIWRYGTWPQFKEISDAGNEIGSHSMTHPHFLGLPIGDTSSEGSLLFELYQAKLLIETKIPDKHCITFAYPYSEHDSTIEFYTDLFYESARAVGPESNKFSLVGMDYFKLTSFPFTFDLPRDSLFDDLDEFEDFKNWVQTSIDSNDWAILQTHEVLPYSLLQEAIQNGLYEPVAAEWFELACGWIKDQETNDQIWTAPIADVTKYMRERDAFFYNIVNVNDNVIQLNFSDTLANEIYNFPLTADIIVPENWNEVTVIQNNRYSYYNSFFDGANFVVRVNAVPDAGLIELYKGHLTNAESITELKPESFNLYQNYPNPFNPSTKIKFDLKSRSVVKLAVFDVLGREIQVLVDNELNAGSYDVIFNADGLASGVYLYKMIVNNKQQTKKIILSK